MKVMVLTGAGVSAESGVRTFRDQDGLWEGHSIEEVATPEGFEANPQLVYEFYNQRRRQLFSAEVAPNPGHMALARMEQALGDQFLLVTQNVDNLHERAGNKNIVHMHGELLKARCTQTRRSFEWQGDLDENSIHPMGLEAPLRPDIVWFGEMPYSLEKIGEHLDGCDLFLCVGTSGMVYPAAGFVGLAPKNCQKVEFNLIQTAISELFDETILGPTGKTLPTWVDHFLEGL
jgi:NAD-dependent deacetylase